MSRNVWGRLAQAGSVAGLVLMAGCSTPPTTQVIDDTYAVLESRVAAAYVSMMAACDNLTGAARDQCIADATAWHNNRQGMLTEGLESAQNKQWDHAQDVEKSILDGLPKEVLDTTKEVVSIAIPNVPKLQQGGVLAPMFLSIGTESKTWPLDGTLTFDFEGVPVSGTITGTLTADMDPVPVGSQERTGTVTGGGGTVTLPNGDTVTMVIETGNGEFLTRDGNGAGEIDFVVGLTHSDEAWDALLQSRMWIRAPIHLSSNDNVLSIQLSQQATEDLYPYQPRAYTDYDLDGVYDIALDTSAFVTAFLTHELRADVNLDGIWDTGDISQWQTHFFEDAAQ